MVLVCSFKMGLLIRHWLTILEEPSTDGRWSTDNLCHAFVKTFGGGELGWDIIQGTYGEKRKMKTKKLVGYYWSY